MSSRAGIGGQGVDREIRLWEPPAADRRPLTVADIRAVRALIEKPGTFIHGRFNSPFLVENPDDPILREWPRELWHQPAVSFCVTDAYMRAVRGRGGRVAQAFIRAYIEAAHLSGEDLDWTVVLRHNDTHSQIEVLEVLDTMIANTQ